MRNGSAGEGRPFLGLLSSLRGQFLPKCRMSFVHSLQNYLELAFVHKLPVMEKLTFLNCLAVFCLQAGDGRILLIFQNGF